jgi:hypothetical protein
VRAKPIEFVVQASANNGDRSVEASIVNGIGWKGLGTRRYPARRHGIELCINRLTFHRPRRSDGVFQTGADDPAKARRVNVVGRRIKRRELRRIILDVICDLGESEPRREIKQGPIHGETESTAHGPKIVQTIRLGRKEIVDRTVGIDVSRLVAEPA